MHDEITSITLHPPGHDSLVASYDYAAPVRIITIKKEPEEISAGLAAIRVVGILNGYPDEKAQLVQDISALEGSICTLNGDTESRKARVVEAESDERSFVIRVSYSLDQAGDEDEV